MTHDETPRDKPFQTAAPRTATRFMLMEPHVRARFHARLTPQPAGPETDSDKICLKRFVGNRKVFYRF